MKKMEDEQTTLHRAYNPATVFRQDLPNSTTVLVLGILSVAFCWQHLLSVTGIILGIITLVLASRETKLYRSVPDKFTLSSMNNVRAGKICAIIGLVVSVVVFSMVIFLMLELLPRLPFWGMTE